MTEYYDPSRRKVLEYLKAAAEMLAYIPDGLDAQILVIKAMEKTALNCEKESQK